MIKLRKEYQKAIKKYGAIKVLNMYRDGKIELNGKEWKSLHRKIDKENQIYSGLKLGTILSAIICFIIIILFSTQADISNFEKIKFCNNIYGHICTKYEIEKMEVMK